MAENKITETIKVVGGKDVGEPQVTSPATKVVLDASTPSVRSIVRVVLITLILLSVASFIESIFSALTHLFFLVVLSIFFAYLIEPLVQLIRRPFATGRHSKFMPRALAIGLAFIIVLSVIGGLVALLTPTVIEQSKQLAANSPTFLSSAQARFKEYNTRYKGYKIPDTVQDTINEKLTTMATYIGESVTGFLITAVYYIPWLILIPVLAFFFLKDANLFRLSLLRFFPGGEMRSRVEMVLHDVNKTLAAYARAQLISCVLIGTICTTAFYLLDVNYAVLLGVMAGIFEFIPLIGPLTLALIAVTVAALTSFSEAASVAAFLGVLRILQDYVFYPRIVREGIHLHPLAIILSVLAGEQIAGIPGVFLSIPIIALLTVAYKHIIEHSQSRKNVASLLAPKDNSEHDSL